jgi:hypothetical protein
LIPEWKQAIREVLGTIRFGVTSMDKSLAKHGFDRDDITDVFYDAFAF